MKDWSVSYSLQLQITKLQEQAVRIRARTRAVIQFTFINSTAYFIPNDNDAWIADLL